MIPIIALPVANLVLPRKYLEKFWDFTCGDNWGGSGQSEKKVIFPKSSLTLFIPSWPRLIHG